VIITDAKLVEMVCDAIEQMSDEEKSAARTELYLHFGLSSDGEYVN